MKCRGMETYAQSLATFGSRWKWFTCTLWQFYTQGKAPCTHWTAGYLWPRAGLKKWPSKKSASGFGIEGRFCNCPATRLILGSQLSNQLSGIFFYMSLINSELSVPGKGYPMSCLWRHRGKAEVKLQPIRSLGARWGGWSTPRPRRFTSGKETPYPLYIRLGGSQGRSEWARKVSPPPGFDPRTIQHIASRYTDYAIPAARIFFTTDLLFHRQRSKCKVM